MRVAVLSGQGPGCAGRVVGRGRLTRRIVGRLALEASAAWPPPSGPGPYPSVGGHVELEVSGRPDARVVRHVRRPASRCRVSAGGTDRSAGTMSRRVSGGRTLAQACARTDCGHVRQAMARSLRCRPGRSRLGAGQAAAPVPKPAYATDPADGRGWRRWVSGYRQAPPMRRRWRAGRGLCSAGSPR
jgi:hypothetical protein